MRGAVVRTIHRGWDCVDGEGGCVVRDCAGSWSACTERCERAAERVWVQQQAPAGSGHRCPWLAGPATDCAPGLGGCAPPRPPPLPPPPPRPSPSPPPPPRSTGTVGGQPNGSNVAAAAADAGSTVVAAVPLDQVGRVSHPPRFRFLTDDASKTEVGVGVVHRP
jgi:hypothetical protein